jgi:hypothetical protein
MGHVVLSIDVVGSSVWVVGCGLEIQQVIPNQQQTTDHPPQSTYANSFVFSNTWHNDAQASSFGSGGGSGAFNP